LDAIQGEADSFPYNRSVKARNALFLDTELRSGSILTGFLGGARITTLLDGQIDLNADPGALSRVSNGVLFTAIRTSWANYYRSLSSRILKGPAATEVVALRNPDVARLEEWEPQVYLAATYSMHMAWDHSAISDLRQRARESGQLSQWQEEGNIVERWAKRCEATGGSDPAKGDLGRYLGVHWAEELKHQLAGQSEVLRPTGWRKPTLLQGATTQRSNEGPIGFALDVISAWHADLVLALQLLAGIKAEVSIPTAKGLQWVLGTGASTSQPLRTSFERDRAGPLPKVS
jgi:hypothetical protein